MPSNCPTMTPLFLYPTTPSYCSESAVLAQSWSINSIARARTRSSLFSKARINGSTAPGGADCAQVSRARSLVPTSGESRSWVIHVGTTRGFSSSVGLVGWTGATAGPSAPGIIPFPDAAAGSFPEVRDSELAAGVAEATRSVPGDGPCLGRGCSPAPARAPRFDVLSDEACPQPARPVRNTRLRSIAMHDRDKCMFVDLSVAQRWNIENGSCAGPLLRITLDNGTRWTGLSHTPHRQARQTEVTSSGERTNHLHRTEVHNPHPFKATQSRLARS